MFQDIPPPRTPQQIAQEAEAKFGSGVSQQAPPTPVQKNTGLLGGVQDKWDLMRSILENADALETMGMPKHDPSVTESMSAKIMGSLRDLAGVPANLIKNMSTQAIDSVVHPIEHAPENIATVATMGEAKLPALLGGVFEKPLMRAAARTGLSAVGGGIGGVIKGSPHPDDDALLQGLLQGTFGEGINALGAISRSVGSHAAASAIAPGEDVLAKMVNPDTGLHYPTPGHAGDAFRKGDGPGSPSVFQASLQVPGTKEYALDLKNKVSSLEPKRQQILQSADANPNLPGISKQTPLGGSGRPGTKDFNQLLAEISQMHPDEQEALSRELNDALGPYQMNAPDVQTVQSHGTGGMTLPTATIANPANPLQPLTYQQASDMAVALGKKLEKRFAEQAAKYQTGGLRPPSDPVYDALAIVRRNLVDDIGAQLPDFKDVNSQFQQLIPRRDAALRASSPAFGDTRVRISADKGSPRAQLYHYISDLSGHISRPLDTAGQALQKASPITPVLSRLLEMMMNKDKQ